MAIPIPAAERPTASGRTGDAGLAEPRRMIHYFAVTKIFDPRTPGAAPVHALDDVTLHVDKGEIFGIIGRRGSGKAPWCAPPTCWSNRRAALSWSTASSCCSSMPGNCAGSAAAA
jgi:hypothetical protein